MPRDTVEKPIVRFVTLAARLGRNTLARLRDALDAAAGEATVARGDLVAVKVHFGEKGNLAYVRPPYVRAVVDFARARGGLPFLTDTNTLYAGTRTSAPAHIVTALENGFGLVSAGAPVVIADGLRGRSAARVAVDGELVREALVGQEIAAADAMLVVSHFKGHELSGFGGAIKNLGMGCAAREGKLAQHSTVAPRVDAGACTACGRCVEACDARAIAIAGEAAVIDPEACVGCASCLVVCPEQAVQVRWNEAAPAVMKKMAEYARAAVRGKEGKLLFVSFLTQISPVCDCYGFNDEPVVPDIGILVAGDPVAIDQAAVDLVVKRAGGADPFRKAHPQIDWSVQLAHAEKMGLGTRAYTIVEAG